MRTLILGAVLLALTACGSNTDEPKGGGAATVRSPNCSDVWVVGKTLPAGYEGCMKDGSIEAAVSYDCKAGGKLIGYNDEFYVVTPGTIAKIKGDDDPAYKAVFDACVAD